MENFSKGQRYLDRDSIHGHPAYKIKPYTL